MAKAEKKEDQVRAVFDRPVRAQYGDIYKVVSGGVCVEYTDKISEAEGAYKDAVKPKEMWKLYRAGGSALVRKDVM